MNKTNRLLSAMLPIMAAGMLMDAGLRKVYDDTPTVHCVPGVRGKPSRLKRKKVKNYFTYYEERQSPKLRNVNE